MSKQEASPVRQAPNYRHFGFALSPHDVREILGLTTVIEVYDRVRTGALAALSTRDEHGDKVLLFHPDEVIAFRDEEIRRSETFEARRLTRAVPILREYLRENAGVDDFDDAVEAGVPLWATTNRGRPVLHVRAEAVAARFNARDEVALQREASITTTMIESALRAIGGVRVKGFIAMADRGGHRARQRWEWWWRLPHDIATEDENSVPDVVPLVRDKGESVSRSGGSVHIDAPLTSQRIDG